MYAAFLINISIPHFLIFIKPLISLPFIHLCYILINDYFYQFLALSHDGCLMTLFQKHIWVLEGEKETHRIYQESLENLHQLTFFSRLKTMAGALNKISQKTAPHLLIADLNLKDGKFLDLLDTASWKKAPKIPFMVVSSVDCLEIARACFNLGALDYLTKPFSANELIIKVERTLKGLATTPPKDPRTDALKLDPTTFTLIFGDKRSKELTAKEFKIIAIFLDSPDLKAHKQEVLDRVWGEGAPEARNSLDVHFHHLRKKLESIGIEITFKTPFYYLR